MFRELFMMLVLIPAEVLAVMVTLLPWSLVLHKLSKGGMVIVLTAYTAGVAVAMAMDHYSRRGETGKPLGDV
jgi:hypothetical protein